jgi:hypothetical protein
MRRVFLSFSLIFGLIALPTPAFSADEIQIRTAPERVGGYDRNLFKHWIDADKNGCDTRKEVLIAEAIVKPKKGAKCVLTGGKWISAYDGKTYTKDASLDIDHMVPLAEAWRSGAWAWTAKQRQDFANDLTDSRALIAVTASANRSKGDQDPKTWLPSKGKCTYIESWVAIKVRYSLTFDSGELSVIQSYFTSCPITNISSEVLSGYDTAGNQVVPTPSVTPTASATPTPTPSVTPTASATPTPTPTTSQLPTVSPGAFCSPAGATGKSSSGVLYTCKTSPTDTRNRWRQ